MLQMPIPLDLKDQNVCILGLGYAGLTLAVAMADAGFRVHGAERRDHVIESLLRGEPHFWEPNSRIKCTGSLARKSSHLLQDA